MSFIVATVEASRTPALPPSVASVSGVSGTYTIKFRTRADFDTWRETKEGAAADVLWVGDSDAVDREDAADAALVKTSAETAIRTARTTAKGAGTP